ncbi:hypothetical protein ACFSUK_22780 [Sphingobium scionense]
MARYRPGQGESDFLATGLDQLMGVAVAPDGAVVVAEYGTGRLLSIEAGAVGELATGLDQPMGVALAPDGTVYVAEAGAGRVVRIAGGAARRSSTGWIGRKGLRSTTDNCSSLIRGPRHWSPPTCRAARARRSPAPCRWGRRLA